MKEHLDENMHNEISKNGNVVFELSKDTYDGNSEKAIFKKLCKLLQPTLYRMHCKNSGGVCSMSTKLIINARGGQ